MSKAWKDLERKAAEMLGGTRVVRANDFGVSDVDVVIPDIPRMKIDAKYRKRHAHHALVEEIRKKYCKESTDVPVLVTKHHSSKRTYVTVDIEFFAEMMFAYKERYGLL